MYDKGTLLTIWYLGLALLGGMLVSGGAAVGLERIAYRPLRKRNAPSLVVLAITAIGASFVIQEFVHFVLPQLTDGKLGGLNALVPIRLISLPRSSSPSSVRTVTNITLIIARAPLSILALGTDTFVNRAPVGPGYPGRCAGPEDRDTDGRVSRERVIMLTFLLGGLFAGAAALLYTLKGPNGIIYSGGVILGIKAFCAAVLGGIGNLRGRAARRPDPGHCQQVRAGAVRRGLHGMSSPSYC